MIEVFLDTLNPITRVGWHIGSVAEMLTWFRRLNLFSEATLVFAAYELETQIHFHGDSSYPFQGKRETPLFFGEHNLEEEEKTNKGAKARVQDSIIELVSQHQTARVLTLRVRGGYYVYSIQR